MTHTPIDIEALKALYQEVRGGSYPYVHGDRRWELLQHFPELIKAAKRATSLRALLAEAGKAADLVLTGGNHLASYKTERWPEPDADHEHALRMLHATPEYDMWCCWSAIMRARPALTAIQTALRDASPTMGKPK